MAEGALERALAEELTKVIQARGLRQTEAAALLGVSTKHLNQVLHLRAHPSIQTLTEWSDRLGIQWNIQAVDLLA